MPFLEDQEQHYHRGIWLLSRWWLNVLKYEYIGDWRTLILRNCLNAEIFLSNCTSEPPFYSTCSLCFRLNCEWKIVFTSGEEVLFQSSFKNNFEKPAFQCPTLLTQFLRKEAQNARFLWLKTSVLGLFLAKTGSINSGIESLLFSHLFANVPDSRLRIHRQTV